MNIYTLQAGFSVSFTELPFFLLTPIHHGRGTPTLECTKFSSFYQRRSLLVFRTWGRVKSTFREVEERGCL